MALLRDYCQEHRLPYDEVGKLVVASTRAERAGLREIADRARANGVPDVAELDALGLREIEPHAVGVGAVHSPHTAVADFPAVARHLAADLDVRLSHPVPAIHETATSVAAGGLRFDRLVVCAGLGTDALAGRGDVRIVPFRGEYFRLTRQAKGLVRGLIYPVPDPRFPFLGVHLTRRIDGEVLVGPNAVMALALEGYSWRDVRVRELARILAWPGTRKMARRHWLTGLRELNGSLRPSAFLQGGPALRPRAGRRRPGQSGQRGAGPGRRPGRRAARRLRHRPARPRADRAERALPGGDVELRHRPARGGFDGSFKRSFIKCSGTPPRPRRCPMVTPEARLLIVEDEPNILELLAASLRYAGFDVSTASSGTEGVAAATRHRPDLIVLDVMLPDMDGFDVVRRLRGGGTFTPVLFLTARDATEDKIRGLTLGGDDYVTKPFSLEEVIARIRAVLRRTAGDPTAPPPRLTFADIETRRGVPRGLAVRQPGPAVADRVQTAALFHGQRWTGAVEGADPGPCVGLRLPGRRGHRGVVRVGAPPQDRQPVGPRLIHTLRGVGYVMRTSV